MSKNSSNFFKESFFLKHFSEILLKMTQESKQGKLQSFFLLVLFFLCSVVYILSLSFLYPLYIDKHLQENKSILINRLFYFSEGK